VYDGGPSLRTKPGDGASLGQRTVVRIGEPFTEPMREILERFGPVAASILIIIVIAVLRERSKAFAAIAATMPMNITLALWLIYSADGTTQTEVVAFVRSMAFGVFASFCWLLAVWVGARAGLRLGWLLLIGYGTWGLLLGAAVLIQSLLGGPRILPF